MDERTIVEVNSGMDQRSNDYMDGINDMILFLGAFNLAMDDDRKRLDGALERIEADMNAIRMMRFIRANMIDTGR